MADEIKRGKFPVEDLEESAFIARSTADIKAGKADYCMWKNILVMGDFDSGACLGVYVARVIRHIEA